MKRGMGSNAHVWRQTVVKEKSGITAWISYRKWVAADPITLHWLNKAQATRCSITLICMVSFGKIVKMRREPLPDNEGRWSTIQRGVPDLIGK